MSSSLVVGIGAVLVTVVFAALLVMGAKWLDRKRGISPEQSRASGLMADKGSPAASFGDFRDLPEEEDRYR